jgi:hypothetical protein
MIAAEHERLKFDGAANITALVTSTLPADTVDSAAVEFLFEQPAHFEIAPLIQNSFQSLICSGVLVQSAKGCIAGLTRMS